MACPSTDRCCKYNIRERSRTASSRHKRFCILIGKTRELWGKKRKRQSPGSVWPGKGQEVKWLTQSSPEQEIQLGLSKLLELNFKLCNFLLWRAFRRRISTFQRGKIGKPPSFSEPVFVCETNTKNPVSEHLPAYCGTEGRGGFFWNCVFPCEMCVWMREKIIENSWEFRRKMYWLW